MTEISADLLSSWKEELHDLSANWVSGVCKGAAYFLDGSRVTLTHTACHSWVGNAYTNARKKSFVVLTCHSKKRSKNVCSAEAHSEIAKWMATESPFAFAILNRDDLNSVCNDGLVILCGEDGVTQWQCYWICKVLRYGVEGAQALDVWYALKQGGVNPILALCIATYIRSVNGATFGYTGADGHSAVFPANSYYGDYRFGGMLTATLTENPNSTVSVFKDPPDFSPKLGFAEVSKSVGGFCKPFKKSDGWGGFVTGEGATEQELVKAALEWQAQLMKAMPDHYLSNQKVVAPKTPDNSTVYLDFDM